MLASAGTKLTVAVRRNFRSNDRGTQVSDVTKKRNWTLAVPIFQFTIRRTHPAERLNAALRALGDSRAFAPAQLPEIPFPNLLHLDPNNAEGFLLRDHANPHFPIGVNRKGVHSPSAEIHALVVC